MLSKELLREVLSDTFENDEKLLSINTVGNNLFFTTDYGEDRINIYELAHKCKERARIKGFELHSAYLDINESVCELYSVRFQIKEFTEDTELEAIFKACQWLLDNEDKQC